MSSVIATAIIVLGPLFVILGIWLAFARGWHWYWAFLPAMIWLCVVVVLFIAAIRAICNMDIG